jgi:16S rRNA G966 N2-methylase RsmD
MLEQPETKKSINVNTITKIGAKNWKHNLSKILFWHPKIQHWKIYNKSYTQTANKKATWFIDPPYSNKAGLLYLENKINYTSLAEYCKSRNGEVIVCEQAGADWLPFKKLCKTISVNKKNKLKPEFIYYK